MHSITDFNPRRRGDGDSKYSYISQNHLTTISIILHNHFYIFSYFIHFTSPKSTYLRLFQVRTSQEIHVHFRFAPKQTDVCSNCEIPAHIKKQPLIRQMNFGYIILFPPAGSCLHFVILIIRRLPSPHPLLQISAWGYGSFYCCRILRSRCPL